MQKCPTCGSLPSEPIVEQSQQPQPPDGFPLSFALTSEDLPTKRTLNGRRVPFYRLGWMVPKQELLDVLKPRRGPKDWEDDHLSGDVFEMIDSMLSLQWRAENPNDLIVIPQVLEEDWPYTASSYLVYIDTSPTYCIRPVGWVSDERGKYVEALRKLIGREGLDDDEPRWYRKEARG